MAIKKSVSNSVFHTVLHNFNHIMQTIFILLEVKFVEFSVPLKTPDSEYEDLPFPSLDEGAHPAGTHS